MNRDVKPPKSTLAGLADGVKTLIALLWYAGRESQVEKLTRENREERERIRRKGGGK